MRSENTTTAKPTLYTIEDIVEEPIQQIKVKRRAARVYLTEAQDGDGNTITGKVFVDGTYLHAYTPETIMFCPGCECGKDPDKIPCELGIHTIEVDGTTAGVYIPWTFGSTAINFTEGDDFTATPILYKYPEVPIAGTMYNFDLPDEIYLEEGSNYRFTIRNQTDSDIPVQLRGTLEFRSVDMDPPKKYSMSTDWGYYSRNNDLAHVLHFAIPSRALKSDMLYAFYDIWSILEGKW
ncbi:MAG: hypothetical protein U9N61_02080 [Euryarchaeota archaeon]|nr:hypothetical protein [Euryarchaeota archaeon]